MSERKVTSNTFNKGMQLDVHPMNTPNDVMTSCLNGTIITFNGNEFMLQTDMGNGRVETAYLPAGYIPVGMVEFGGIIYVASYNPLNNRGQIGSFPSPERNISTDETSKNIVVLSNSDFNFTEKDGAKTFYVQKDLYKDKLSPGDKYLVYSENGDISGNYKKLYDFDADESNAYFYNNEYYKTKPVKLSFATITDEGKIVKLTNNRLFDIIVNEVNKKYIIPEMNYKSDGSPNVDSYRNVVTSPYNIFNSKVSGKLILIAELVTIDDFSVSIICQAGDGVGGLKDISIIASMEYTSDKNVFLNGVKSKCIDSKNQGVEISGSDLWRVKIDETDGALNENRYREALLHKVLNYDYINKEKRSITYILTPCMTYGEISYLKKTGIIQLDKIGSGLIELYEWRYYVDNSNIMLNWALQAYPEEGYNISGVRMIMSCYNDNSNTETIIYNVSNKKSYSGSFTETIPFDVPYFKIDGNKSLKRNKLYYVTIEIMYKKSTNQDTYLNPNEDTERYVYYNKWMYTCPIFNETYINGTVYDFINENPVLEFDSNTDNIILEKESDDKLEKHDGLFSSRDKISESDTMTMNQYESNFRVAGTINSFIKNNYNLFFVDKNTINTNVYINNEDVNIGIVNNIIKSTKGDVTYTAEQNLEIKKRESYEGDFIPTMTKENIWDKNIHNNDIRLKNVYNSTSNSSLFEFSKQGYPLLQTIEYVKAYGTISDKKVSFEKTVRPICFEENDFAKYGIRWENGKFIATNIVGFALDDRQGGGGNGEPWIRFCRIGATGNETNPKDIRIEGDHKDNGENDPRFRMLGDEFVNKSKESWGDDNYNKNIIFCAYAIYDDSRGKDISTSIGVKLNGDTLRRNYLWEYNYLGPNTDYTALGVSDKRDIAGGQILSGKTYLFTMLKSKVGNKFVPLNMASRPFTNRDSNPYQRNWNISSNLGLKSHWEAVAAMLMQLYKVVDDSGSTVLYSIDNGFYNSKVLSEFYVNINISISSSENTKIRMFNENGIYIDDNMKSVLFDKNKSELYNKSVSDNMNINNNIIFKFVDNEIKKTISYQSSRSFDSIASELIAVGNQGYTAIIEKCDGSIGYTNMSVSKNNIYYIDNSSSEVSVKKLDGNCSIYGGTFSMSETRMKFEINKEYKLSSQNDFSGNYLTVDDKGDLYFNDEYHSEGELNDNKLISVANKDFDGNGDEKTSSNRWFRGWSLFGPISKLKSYKK